MVAIEQMLDDTAKGAGRVALVAGEPGIGKTRLLMEIAERAQEKGWLVLVGRAYESEGMPPYLPFVEALGPHLRSLPHEQLEQELGERAGQLALIFPELGETSPSLDTRQAMDPNTERYRLFEAICGYLTDLAAVPGRAGVLLGLEDLQWADASSLLLLEHLGHRVSEGCILVVANHRDVELRAASDLARTLEQLARLGISERFSLRGLDRAKVGDLLTRLGGLEPPPRVVEVIYQETEGNPLFVGEVYRYLCDEGRLLDSEGHWRTDLELGEVDVPRGVRLVIGRRLDRVGDACRRALTAASIIGREFDFNVLSEVSQISELDLLDAMDEAERAQLVSSGTDARAAAMTFTHELIRQTLASELSLPRRQVLHVAVAEAIEKLHAGSLEPHSGELAQHYSFGSGGAAIEKAVIYALAAARQAQAVFAYQEAVHFYQKALDALDRMEAPDNCLRCDLLIELGQTLLAGGEAALALDMAERAFELAASLNDGARASAACRGARLDILHSRMGVAPQSEVFQTWAARAARYAAAGTLDRAAACVMLADTLIISDRRPEAWELYREAFDIALQYEDAELLYDIATQVAGWGASPARERERYEIMMETMTRPRAISTHTLGRFGMYEGWLHLDWGNAELGERAWHELAELAGRSHNAYVVPFAARTEVIAALLAGDLEEAVVAADLLIADADKGGGQVSGRVMTCSVVHRALLHLGRPMEALARLDEAIKVAALSDVPNTLTAARMVTLADLSGDESCRRELVELLRKHEPDPNGENWPTHVLLGALNASIALSDERAVDRLYSILAPTAELAMGFLLLASPARLLGDAAAFLGRPDEAKAYYARAIATAGRIGFRPEVALAHLRLAELLSKHYRTERSAILEHLAFAIPELRSMGMTPWLERARLLQDRLASRRRPGPTYPGGLSEREVQVLRLVAAGASSRVIGEELVLSVRTVERHIANIYFKTDTRGRAQATAFALAHGLA